MHTALAVEGSSANPRASGSDELDHLRTFWFERWYVLCGR
jgi:hypothetical protein